MKKVKAIIGLLMALVICASLFAGCAGDAAGGESSAAGSESGDQEQQASGSAQAADKVKLQALFSKSGLTKDVNEMKWLMDLQDASNVEVEWQQITADWDQKKSVLFASGSIPDLLFAATADSDYIQFDGLFEDLAPLIESYAPNVQAMFEEHPELKTLATMQDGRIFATPSYKGGLWPDSSNSMFINTVWLENVGMETPTTWDELKEVLIAFRDQDANGNGDPNDEIPFDFNDESWDFSIKCLLGSMGMQISDGATDGYFAEDAKISNYFIDERFKELMIFMQDLYSEKLLNEEIITQDYSMCQSLARGDGDTAKVGYTFGWEVGDKFGNQLAGQYVAFPQLKVSADSTDDLRWHYERVALNASGNRVAMSANCENKEAAMRFIDGFYDEVLSPQVLFGGMNDTDKGIVDNGDGTYQVLPPADSSIDPGSWKWGNTFGDSGPYYVRDGWKLGLGTDMAVVLVEKENYNPILAKADPKKDIYPTMFMKYSADDLNTLAMNQANINNITWQQWAVWVTTDADIEAEWDAYVQSVYDMGLQQNLDIRQAAFDAYLSTLA